MNFPWLSWLVFLPLAGAVLLVSLPAAADRWHRRWAMTVALGEFALSVPLWWRSWQPGWQLVEQRAWLPAISTGSMAAGTASSTRSERVPKRNMLLSSSVGSTVMGAMLVAAAWAAGCGDDAQQVIGLAL
mgnify:CR=1 FL=1